MTCTSPSRALPTGGIGQHRWFVTSRPVLELFRAAPSRFTPAPRTLLRWQPRPAGAGAELRVPLRGLTQGQHLAWYGQSLPSPMSAPTDAVDTDAEAAAAIIALQATEPAPASAFPWGRKDLRSAGLYAWWVDSAGAADLDLSTTRPLTLIYAGQAVATQVAERQAKRRNSLQPHQYAAPGRSHLVLDLSGQTLAALLRQRLDFGACLSGRPHRRQRKPVEPLDGRAALHNGVAHGPRGPSWRH